MLALPQALRLACLAVSLCLRRLSAPQHPLIHCLAVHAVLEHCVLFFTCACARLVLATAEAACCAARLWPAERTFLPIVPWSLWAAEGAQVVGVPMKLRLLSRTFRIL
jgi:hypothetical protein